MAREKAKSQVNLHQERKMSTNVKNKGGRPKKYDIDTEEVFKLASYGCTNTEIADFFGCSKDLISKSYSTNVLKGRTDLKKRLRKAQIDSALGGNSTMLIWLGKQYLEQTEKSEVEWSNPISGVEFIDVVT